MNRLMNKKDYEMKNFIFIKGFDVKQQTNKLYIILSKVINNGKYERKSFEKSFGSCGHNS